MCNIKAVNRPLLFIQPDHQTNLIHKDSSRVAILDPLRGLAALAVCWHHFAVAEPNRLLYLTSQYGNLGVEVFFVISGFVVPYSLSRAGYSIGSYQKFLVKRIARLDPPYIASILLALFILYLRFALHGFQPGYRPNVSAFQLLLHLGYLNAFFNYAWIVALYWTLAIEFQFYLSIGLLFPLISHRSLLIRFMTMCCLAALFLITPNTALITHYVFLFLLGVVTYQFKMKLINTALYLFCVAVLFVLLIVTLGVATALAGVATALTISFINADGGGMLRFFGKISYSLYLTHMIIGSGLIEFGVNNRVHSLGGRICLYLAAFGLTISFAYCFYRLIEGPALRWSKKLSYRSDSMGKFESDKMLPLFRTHNP